MFLAKKIDTLQDIIHQIRGNSPQTVGFIPTMGALHNGHISLIRKSKEAGHLTICSIYVNPTQFNQQEDFLKYPKTIVEDIIKLEEAGCDILFHPENSEMYPAGMKSIQADYGSITNTLEGFFRPGHFDGVVTIVGRLLDAVKPDHLFMGQKDYQQCAVIAKLLSLQYQHIKLEIVPTVRETDGLAMSSRNVRLSELERKDALKIYETLNWVKSNYQLKGYRELLEEAKKILSEKLRVEYVDIVDADSLESLENKIEGRSAVCLIAAWCGSVRLIDNMIIS